MLVAPKLRSRRSRKNSTPGRLLCEAVHAAGPAQGIRPLTTSLGLPIEPQYHKTSAFTWSKADVRELKAHSRSKSPVKKIAKAMKRTVGALRQKALSLGLPLGHRR
jgi:hypothetical protein